jgi:hypothetical protein
MGVGSCICNPTYLGGRDNSLKVSLRPTGAKKLVGPYLKKQIRHGGAHLLHQTLIQFLTRSLLFETEGFIPFFILHLFFVTNLSSHMALPW